jgi:energy-coupling factor transporter transmembrane protein EcfT
MKMMKRTKLGRYIPGTSIIHQLDPRTKLLGWLAMVTAILVSYSWPVLLLNTALIFVVIYLAQTSLSSVMRGVKWLWLVFICSFLAQCICTQGAPLFNLGPLTVTVEGVYRGLSTFLRLLILFLSSTILTMTTSPMKLARGLEALLAPLARLGVPVNQFAMLITISLRFIPTLLEEAETITRAQKSRGAPFTSPKKLVRLKTSLAVLIPLVMDTKNVTNVAVSYDSRENSSSYDIAFFKLLDLSVGDNVQIVFNPLGINVKTRIISLEYNPFYRYNIRVEVGSYRPSISDTFYRIESSITGVSHSVDNVQNQVWDLQVSYTIVKELSIVDNTINVTYEVEKGESHQYHAQYSFTTDGSGRITSITLEDIFSELLLKEVASLLVDAAAFEVTYADGSTANYTYTTDSSGRITAIEKV